jgi:hypothetical protein
MLRTLKNWLKDLLYDSTNDHLDNGRFIAFLSLITMISATCWNIHLKQEIKLNDLGNGLGVVLTALVIYVYHDRKLNDGS